MKDGEVLNFLVRAFLILLFSFSYVTDAQLELLTKSMILEKPVNVTICVNETTMYIYNITFPPLSDPLRISVEGFHIPEEFPIIVLVWNDKDVMSWKIPYVSGNLTYPKVSRTLCRGKGRNNLSITKGNPNAEKEVLRVSITTASPENLSVNLRIEHVPSFIVKTNETYYGPPIDADKGFQLTPSEPWYYQFNWQEDAQSVLLMVNAKDGKQICMTLSIQPIECPVLDTETSVGNAGYWQTIDHQGGITIQKKAFPDGFYIVFIINEDDQKCLGKQKIEPLVFKERSKTITFNLTETISDFKLYLALASPLMVYTSVCLCFLVGACFYSCNAAPRFKSTSPSVNPAQSSLETLPSQERRQRRQPQEEGNFEDVVEVETIGYDARSEETLKGKKNIFVCDLARKDTRILRRKSDLYVFQLFTVAVFYSLPVAQLMFSYQKIMHTTGNQDVCYYNFLCSFPLITNPSIYSILDFNHVFSNIGYVVLGLLFCAWTLRRDSIHTRAVRYCPDLDKLYGIPQHYGLFYAIGSALVVEGFLSACYHICPNKTNFQFDTSFMYVIAVLCMVKLYHNRHPDINASAYTIFFILALIIFFGMIGITESSDNFFIFISGIHIVVCFWLSLRVYNMGETNLYPGKDFMERIKTLPRNVVDHPREYLSPDHPSRFALLMIGNVLNGIVIYIGWSTNLKNNNFGSYMLAVLLANLMLYFIFYILMKLVNGERLLFQPCLFFILSLTLGVSSCLFFFTEITSWQNTPAVSRRGNGKCIPFLDFYDEHDVWHFLSAGGMFCTFMVLLTLDDDLIYVPRSQIPVF